MFKDNNWDFMSEISTKMTEFIKLFNNFVEFCYQDDRIVEFIYQDDKISKYSLPRWWPTFLNYATKIT